MYYIPEYILSISMYFSIICSAIKILFLSSYLILTIIWLILVATENASSLTIKIGILDVAKEGQHPRAYEVAGNLIKSVADTVDKLQDLNKKLKDLKELPKTANANIKNALFVGSTAELQKMLKKDEVI